MKSIGVARRDRFGLEEGGGSYGVLQTKRCAPGARLKNLSVEEQRSEETVCSYLSFFDKGAKRGIDERCTEGVPVPGSEARKSGSGKGGVPARGGCWEKRGGLLGEGGRKLKEGVEGVGSAIS